MVADSRIASFHRARVKLSLLVTPFQYLVDLPIRLMNTLSSDLSSRQRLIEENSKLQADILLLQAKLQKQFAIESENQQLRQLLGSMRNTNTTVTVGELLAVRSPNFKREVLLNKGSNNHIFVGQPVMDASGIMGQVIDVNPLNSTVMLITDARSSIPLQVKRNNMRVIAEGVPGMGLLRLNGITKTDDIQKGDILVTSGLGGRYPYGYPVGTVIYIKNAPGMRFSEVLIKPSAHLNRSRLVMFLWNKN